MPVKATTVYFQVHLWAKTSVCCFSNGTCHPTENCLSFEENYYCVPPSTSPSGHRQCAMLLRRCVSRNAAGKGRALLEGVGSPLRPLRCATQTGLTTRRRRCSLACSSGGLVRGPAPPGQSSLRQWTEIGVQHISALEEEVLKGTVLSQLVD